MNSKLTFIVLSVCLFGFAQAGLVQFKDCGKSSFKSINFNYVFLKSLGHFSKKVQKRVLLKVSTSKVVLKHHVLLSKENPLA